MIGEPVGTQGSPVEPTGGGAPLEPTAPTAPQGTFVDVDGQKIPHSELLDTYRNKSKWQATNTQRAEDIRRQREYLEDLQSRMQPLVELDEGFFKRNPGSEDELKQFAIELQRKHMLGTTQPAPLPGQPAVAPQQASQLQPYIERLDRMEQRLAEEQSQREITMAWDTFERNHQGLTELERAAVRGRLPFIPSEGLNDVGMLERAYRDVEQMRMSGQPAPNAAAAQRDRMAALSNVGLSPAQGGNTQPVDLSGKNLRQSKDYFKNRLKQGLYHKG